jgi:hypothetical protein
MPMVLATWSSAYVTPRAAPYELRVIVIHAVRLVTAENHGPGPPRRTPS